MIGHVAGSLIECNLDPAHYITAFFLLGFERGHRWRHTVATMINQEAVTAAMALIARQQPSPMTGAFQAGFDLGFGFEPRRAADE